jgi:hypothetical protein
MALPPSRLDVAVVAIRIPKPSDAFSKPVRRSGPKTTRQSPEALAASLV